MKRKLRALMMVLLLAMACFGTSVVALAEEEDGADQTAPIVTDVTILTESVNKPGTIQLELNLVEEDTGVNRIDVGLYCLKGGRPIVLSGSAAYSEDVDSIYTGRVVVEVPVEAGNAAGTYLVGLISVTDNAGNVSTYFNHYSTKEYLVDDNGAYLPLYEGTITDGSESSDVRCYIVEDKKVEVISNGDDTAPIVTTAKVLTPAVEKPGIIQVEFDVVEESEIKSLNVMLGGKKNGRPIMIGYTDPKFSVSGSKVTVDVEVTDDNTSGTYYIELIQMEDNEGNIREYMFNYDAYKYYTDEDGAYLVDMGATGYKCYVEGDGTSVVASTGDDVAPCIESVKVGKNTVVKPGVLPITFKLKAADEIKWIEIKLRELNGDEQKVLWYRPEFEVKESKSEITVKMPIGTAAVSTKYHIDEITISDYSANQVVYSNENSAKGYMIDKDGNAYMIDRHVENNELYVTNSDPIVVEDEFDVAFEVSLSNKNLLKKINNMKEGKTGRIFIDGKGIVSKEVFEAIQGKDKTLVFYKNNYQWVINGKNVTNPKEIKLKITFDMVDGAEYGVDGKLFMIKFEDNGELPGLTNVRIKSDYTFEIYDVAEKMYLYYLNPKTEDLDLEKGSDINYTLDGEDHWCQFDITHNSTYMVSSNKIVKVKKIVIDGISHKIAAGCQVKLTATVKPANASMKSVTWKSSNTKYATVTKKGVVKVKKAGIGKTVKITATAKDGSGVKKVFKITIMKDAVTKIKLSGKESVKVGKSITLKAKVFTTGKNANTKLKWVSSNTKYATVDKNGVVTAKKAGKGKTITIKVMATDGSGVIAKMKIKIK